MLTCQVAQKAKIFKKWNFKKVLRYVFVLKIPRGSSWVIFACLRKCIMKSLLCWCLGVASGKVWLVHCSLESFFSFLLKNFLHGIFIFCEDLWWVQFLLLILFLTALQKVIPYTLRRKASSSDSLHLNSMANLFFLFLSLRQLGKVTLLMYLFLLMCKHLRFSPTFLSLTTRWWG